MNVLIVGGGGREHALAWKLAQSPRVDALYCAPGNAGTALLGENLPCEAADIAGLLALARSKNIGLTVVGPEDPLCAGIVDTFSAAGLRIFGPSAAAARLEGDKAYAKQIMRQAAIPMAEGRIFEDYKQARSYVASREGAVVIKAAGLAKGKGVLICEDPAEALVALETIMVKKAFGPAGDTVIVDEKLTGVEVSVQALVDGRSIYILEMARDYKRLGDGDTGPNTGGMGAYSPTGVLDDQTIAQVCREVLVPLTDALNRQETPYVGVLYAGLMITAGGPKVLEFNCRFGDPETQAIVPRLKSDLLGLLEACIDGSLDQATIEWDPRPSVCVVLASRGYPGEHAYGKVVHGLQQLDGRADVWAFHAGTTRLGGQVRSVGGRVLGVTALGDDLLHARTRAYEALESIEFEGATYRSDIALHGG